MRSLLSFNVLVSALLIAASQAKTSEDWRSRTVYKILVDRFSPSVDTTAPCWDLSNYCGGTWRGLQNHLDYLTNMGIDAIWISPIVKNTPGGYHGYWLEDLSKVNPHFGTEEDLISLINAAHEKGVYVMLDVVANHVGPVGWDYRSIVQFNQPYHYHDCNGCPRSCDIEDFQNQYQVEHCRLSGLPDLDQSNDYVQRTLLDWVRNTVQKYKFDGIRIDTVPEVPKWFWSKFASAAGVFQIGEVFDGRMDYVASYQPLLTSVLSYPMYFTVKDVFAHRHSMYKLRYTLQSYESSFHDTSVLGSFLDNHDNARFLSFQPDHALYKAALAFTLHATGMPIIYYGTEQGFNGGNDPKNREPLWQTGFNTNAPLYTFLKKTIEARKKYQVWLHQQVERYVDDQFFAFSRGNVFVALTNVGSGGGTVRRQITYHPYTPGTKLCNIYWPTDCVQVNHAGFPVTLNHGETKIFVPA